MKFWIGLILLIGVKTSLIGQTYFNVLDSNTFLNSASLEMNNGYIVCGDLWSIGGSRSVALKQYELNGDINIIDTLNEYPLMSSRSKLLRKNIGFYSTNIINNNPPFSAESNNIELSYFSNIGNEIWSITYGENFDNQEAPSNVILTSDGFILISGVTNSFGDSDTDFYLIKLDTFGNIIWEKFYNSFYSDISYSINETAEGDFLISGVSTDFSAYQNIYIVKLNSEGDVLWEQTYDSGNSDWGGGLTITIDNSFILYHNITLNNNNTIGIVEKFDGNGDLIWSQPFASSFGWFSFSFGEPIENTDGTIMVNSGKNNSLGSFVNEFIKLDPYGNVLFSKEYFTRQDASQYIYDIKPTTDGGYIMAGSAFPVSVNQQHAWLIKTNCNGEDGVQYPITGVACAQYDCTLYPIDANFTANKYIVDLAETNGDVEFTNTSANTTSRVWSFGDGAMDYTDAVLIHTYQTEGTYQAQLITFHGTCSDTTIQTIEVINSLGLTTISKPTLKIFPNPSNGEFTIAFSHPTTATAQIIDATGRVVSIIDISERKNNYKITDLVTGVYSIIINYGDGLVETKRIIIL